MPAGSSQIHRPIAYRYCRIRITSPGDGCGISTTDPRCRTMSSVVVAAVRQPDAIAFDAEHAAGKGHRAGQSARRTDWSSACCLIDLGLRLPASGSPEARRERAEHLRPDRPGSGDSNDERPAVRRVRERRAGWRAGTAASSFAERRQPRRHAAPLAAVERVAHDRMPGLAQMHANLMRAARANRHAHERDAAQRLRASSTRVTADRVLRARLDIFCRCRGSRPIGRDSVSPARIVPQTSARYSLPTLPILKLLRQRSMRRVGLGHHHHARRAAIEPMHDARPFGAADRR